MIVSGHLNSKWSCSSSSSAYRALLSSGREQEDDEDEENRSAISSKPAESFKGDEPAVR